MRVLTRIYLIRTSLASQVAQNAWMRINNASSILFKRRILPNKEVEFKNFSLGAVRLRHLKAEASSNTNGLNGCPDFDESNVLR